MWEQFLRLWDHISLKSPPLYALKLRYDIKVGRTATKHFNSKLQVLLIFTSPSILCAACLFLSPSQQVSRVVGPGSLTSFPTFAACSF